MRVIAGEFKGRRLNSPKGDTMRPTTDKVKEAMFGALQFLIDGARVLDAFAGSGALGIEALSRGAAHVDFVEKEKICQRVLMQNLSLLGISNYTLHRGDAVGLMPALGQYDILLADPPYDAALYGPLLEAAHTHHNLKDGATVVLECRRSYLFDPPAGYILNKRKDYGDISLLFLTYGEKCD